ncbi:MAG: ExbD/TolR family protein [Kiloniellaceae bacterium]
MRFKRRDRQADTEERILPLINVVFLLLIFFMLAGRLTESAPFDVQPPTSAAAGVAPPAADGAPREAVVLLAADGRLALDGEPMEAAAVRQTLAGRLAAAPGQPVHLKADGAAEAAAVVAVMETLRDAGVHRLQLFTLAAAPGTSPEAVTGSAPDGGPDRGMDRGTGQEVQP